MKLGAWIHDQTEQGLRDQIRAAGTAGFAGIRSYSLDYSTKVAPQVAESGMTLLAGIHVDGPALAADWRSQVKLDELAATAALNCKLAGICVGNELREGGDEPEKKRFTARLSFGLARVLETYREWLANHNHDARLTYAMEGLVFDRDGQFKEHLWPLIDACDVVSLNSYPMSNSQWFTFDAFEESRKFLTEAKAWRRRLSEYESKLRMTLEVLEAAGKTVFLSEMGFPSGVGYSVEEPKRVIPVHDRDAFALRVTEYVQLLAGISQDYSRLLDTVYFYEWWDNYHHSKIWNVEQSPIHTCFGLCDETGAPKLDIGSLVDIARG